jgi:hypothetical protein
MASSTVEFLEIKPPISAKEKTEVIAFILPDFTSSMYLLHFSWFGSEGKYAPIRMEEST